MTVQLRSVLILTLLASAVRAADPSDADLIFFESKIRPLLVETCFKCHSVSEKKKKGGLHVDSLAALLKGGETGPALAPGKPEASKLVEAVTYKNPDLQMPPKGKLSDTQIADLTEWVKRGAPWPKEAAAPVADSRAQLDDEKKRRMAEHWAWQPLTNPSPPKVKNNSWVSNGIDSFILAKLEEKKLKPAPPAEKRTLIRRATLDLIGLPPTPEEVDAFVNDKSKDAFKKVVERLLASPHYGERWGRHWLDVARYADSNGMDENHAYANAYHYRDYVIAAFNKDKPYDQFVREQLAGDLMPAMADRDETVQRQIATGFLALGPKVLAEPDPRKMEMDIVDEQLDTTGRAFMGLTFGCCRCHDHKFDPLPTADYYSLAAIFKSTRVMENFTKVARWYERPLGLPEEVAARDAHDTQIKKKKAEFDALLKVENDRLLAKYRESAGQYLAAAAEVLRAPAGAKPPGAKDVAASKNLNEEMLKKWIEHLKRTDSGRDPIFHAFNEFRKLAPDQFGAGAAAVVQRISDKTLDTAGPLNAAVRAAFANATPASLEDVAKTYARLFDEAGQAWRILKAKPEGKDAKSLPDTAQEALRLVLLDAKSGPISLPKEPEKLYAPESAAKVKAVRDGVAALEKSRPVLADAMGAAEGEKLASLKIHIRGNPQTLGIAVPKRFPAVLAGDTQTPLSDQQSGRLEFANWLTRPENPLTSRVMANRIWRWHFGSGIVNTPDNFGLLGEKPSHPELLDYLSAEFVRCGWSIKHMHRLIMFSSTYRQSVVANEKYSLVDPQNRLYWRMDRRRLEAEVIRDSVLAISGELDLKLGGSLMDQKNRDYINNDKILPLYNINRRSIYLPVIRNSVFDVFQAFDFPDPNVINGNRATTTVAPQALFMMNGKLVLDQSRKFSDWLLKQSGLDDAGRVRAAYEKAFSRAPSKGETARALEFVRQYSQALSQQEKPPASAEILARAWQGLCQVIVASNEFVYVD